MKKKKMNNKEKMQNSRIKNKERCTKRYLEIPTKLRSNSFWFVLVGLLFIVIGVFLFMKGTDKEESYIAIPQNHKELQSFLKDNSNYYDVVQEWRYQDFWPCEYWEINIKDREIGYYKADSLVATIKYKRTKNNNIVDFDNDSSKIFFGGISNLEGIAELVEKEFKDEIDNEKIPSNNDTIKNLCYLYNALVGHRGSYVLLGRKKEEEKWSYYCQDDFPKYRIEKKSINAIVDAYIDSVRSSSVVIPLDQSMKTYVVDISAVPISYNYRKDTIWYGGEARSTGSEKVRKELNPPYDYDKLSYSACGWVVPPGQDEMCRAKEYYNKGEEFVYIKDECHSQLNHLRWNEVECKNDSVFSWLPLILFMIGVVIVVAFAPWRRMHRNKHVNLSSGGIIEKNNSTDDKEDKEGETTDESDYEKIMRILENVDRILVDSPAELNPEELKKQIQSCLIGVRDMCESLNNGLVDSLKKQQDLRDELNVKLKKTLERDGEEYRAIINRERKEAVECYKSSDTYKSAMEAAKKEAIEGYRSGNIYKNAIRDAGKEAVEDYKRSAEHKNLEIGYRNWKNLLRCGKEADVIRYLNDIHEKDCSFPLIRSLANIYDEVKGTSKSKLEQISKIIEVLEKQLNATSGLNEEYTKLCKKARYADEVRDRFDRCMEISKEYKEREEYKQIISAEKEWTLWDRLAVMLWTMECANAFLSVFTDGSSCFSSAIYTKAVEMHKNDIMQIYATRIFKNYMDEPSALPGMFAASREKMMREKINAMEKYFHISLMESSSYKEFVAALDSVYDLFKRDSAFVRIMKTQFVDNLAREERNLTDEGRYLSLVVAMGLHMFDYIRYRSGIDVDYCPNVKFVLSGLDINQLDRKSEFRYNDPEYSGNYANQVYTWLKQAGVEHMNALVGNKLIMP